MKKKPNVKNALIGLDMIHADLWHRIRILKQSNKNSLIINRAELEALELLTRVVMIDLGFDKFKGVEK